MGLKVVAVELLLVSLAVVAGDDRTLFFGLLLVVFEVELFRLDVSRHAQRFGQDFVEAVREGRGVFEEVAWGERGVPELSRATSSMSFADSSVLASTPILTRSSSSRMKGW